MREYEPACEGHAHGRTPSAKTVELSLHEQKLMQIKEFTTNNYAVCCAAVGMMCGARRALGKEASGGVATTLFSTAPHASVKPCLVHAPHQSSRTQSQHVYDTNPALLCALCAASALRANT